MMKITITRVKRSIIIIIISSTTMNPNDQKKTFCLHSEEKKFGKYIYKDFYELMYVFESFSTSDILEKFI